MDDLCLLFVPGDELVSGTQCTFQQAGLLHHPGPVFGIHGKLVIGTFAVVIIGKVALHNTCPESHRAQHRRQRVGMIRKAQDDIREHDGISLEHVQVQVIIVVGAGSVVGVALHQT